MNITGRCDSAKKNKHDKHPIGARDIHQLIMRTKWIWCAVIQFIHWLRWPIAIIYYGKVEEEEETNNNCQSGNQFESVARTNARQMLNSITDKTKIYKFVVSFDSMRKPFAASIRAWILNLNEKLNWIRFHKIKFSRRRMVEMKNDDAMVPATQSSSTEYYIDRAHNRAVSAEHWHDGKRSFRLCAADCETIARIRE